jgi:hypothetical protein
MSEAPATPRSRTPWHVWVVGILSLLWNAMGAFDYLMTETRNATYMSQFTPEQLAYFYGFPKWVVAAWAIAVWGGVLGSVLLLLRRGLAAPVFLVSFLSLLVTMIHNYMLSPGLEVMGGSGPIIFSLVIAVVAILLYVYARGMQSRGVLA